MKCKFCKEDIVDGAIKCKHCGSILNGTSINNIKFKMHRIWKWLGGVLLFFFILGLLGNDNSTKNNNIITPKESTTKSNRNFTNANSLVTTEYLHWELVVEKNSQNQHCMLKLESKKFGYFYILSVFSSDYWTAGYGTLKNGSKLKDKNGVVSFTIDNKIVETMQLRHFDHGDGIAGSNSKLLSDDSVISLLEELYYGTTLEIHGSALHNSFFVDLTDFKQYLKKYDSCLNTYFINDDEDMIKIFMMDPKNNYGSLRRMRYFSDLRDKL